jgi:hypothetical protein
MSGRGMPEFIFMLTRNDETVPNARALYTAVRDSGVKNAGCKDIGLPRSELETLLAEIRVAGHTSYLEVVSDSEEATLRSAAVAAEIGPDYLIGGTLIEPIKRILDGSGIKFFPYIGRIIGHPCLLRGSIEQICEDARRAEMAGVDGINLLAYRYDGDVRRLVEAVSATVSLPLICAGSVDSVEKIRDLASLDVWAFTIGTAVLDRKIVPAASIQDQIESVLKAARESEPQDGAERRLSA